MRVLHRAAALASVMLGRQSIAVAGTHGKTTTTSMITTVLRRCGADPGYVIGGILAETGLGAADGRGTAFVAEADESDGSFLMLAPDAAIVTCVEADHLDNYGSLAEIETRVRGVRRQDHARRPPGDVRGRSRCGELAAAVQAPGPGARPGAQRELRRVGRRRLPGGGVTPAGMATEFDLTPAGRSARAGTGTVRLRIAVPGRHNALNAAAAYAAAVELGFDGQQVAAGLGGYRGARRRMEPKGEADLVRVLDSYAHHPTELAADLSAARDIAAGGGRVIVVFQPHLFSRTRIFAGQFGAALGQADEVFVLDVYAAREDPEPGVTGALVADAVPGGRAVFCRDRGSVPAAVADVAKPGDVVLTMGAGDVTMLGPLIVERPARPGGRRRMSAAGPGRPGRRGSARSRVEGGVLRPGGRSPWWPGPPGRCSARASSWSARCGRPARRCRARRCSAPPASGWAPR